MIHPNPGETPCEMFGHMFTVSSYGHPGPCARCNAPQAVPTAPESSSTEGPKVNWYNQRELFDTKPPRGEPPEPSPDDLADEECTKHDSGKSKPITGKTYWKVVERPSSKPPPIDEEDPQTRIAQLEWELRRYEEMTKAGVEVYRCPFCDSELTLKIDGGRFMACEDDHCPVSHLDLRLSRLKPALGGTGKGDGKGEPPKTGEASPQGPLYGSCDRCGEPLTVQNPAFAVEIREDRAHGTCGRCWAGHKEGE